MTKGIDDGMTPADFERLLAIYGSDRTRWPVAARASAGQLVARTPEARRMLAEAEALDRVLERAPLPSLAREALLTERILTSARRSPRMVTASAKGVPAAAASRTAMPSALPARSLWLSRKTAVGSAAGTLAAALVLGVFIGLSSLSQSVLPALEQLTGIALSSAPVAGQVDLLDEDLL